MDVFASKYEWSLPMRWFATRPLAAASIFRFVAVWIAFYGWLAASNTPGGSIAQAQLFQRRPLAAPPLGEVETQIVASSTQVLDEVMAEPGKAIPHALLADAQGLAIVPSLLKGGFVLGVKHGRGVVVVRDPQGVWQPPKFLTITGGSVGWQAGVQQSDLVLVFKTARSIDSLLKGKLTLGADVAAAAGPVGRQAAAATDVGLQAEIYSYSRSRGLFAGLALDGSVMQLDGAATAAYYATAQPMPPIPGAVVAVPPTAERLLAQIAAHARSQPYLAPTSTPTLAPIPMPNASPPLALSPASGPTNAELSAARRELGASYGKLQSLVDDHWRQFLGLPPNFFEGPPPANPREFDLPLQRYDRVSRDPAYQTLGTHPAFQQTHQDLKRLAATVFPPNRGSLSLPPPPPR
jgi:lipid-binding SYLF domain-containing protein